MEEVWAGEPLKGCLLAPGRREPRSCGVWAAPPAGLVTMPWEGPVEEWAGCGRYLPLPFSQVLSWSPGGLCHPPSGRVLGTRWTRMVQR